MVTISTHAVPWIPPVRSPLRGVGMATFLALGFLEAEKVAREEICDRSQEVYKRNNITEK